MEFGFLNSGIRISEFSSSDFRTVRSDFRTYKFGKSDPESSEIRPLNFGNPNLKVPIMDAQKRVAMGHEKVQILA